MPLPPFRTLIPSCLFLLAAGPGGFLDSTPATAAVTGAAASATISVNDRPAAPRQGTYFADELSLNNSASPVAAEVAVAATLGGTTETRTREASVPAAASVLEYDDDGNLSFDGAREYTWDAERGDQIGSLLDGGEAGARRASHATTRMASQHRLLEIKTRAGFETVGAIFPSFRQQMEYDDLGRRIRSRLYHRINLVEHLVRDDVFVYDGWKLITTLSGQSGDVLQRFAWGLDLSHTIGGAGNVSGLLVFEDTALGQSHFPRFDGNGNVIGLIAATDPVGAPVGTPNAGEVSATYEYDPFGIALGATGHAAARNPFRFSTTYQDPVTGFSYYGYRFYDPGHGRWLNRDPIAEAGGLNLYGFVGNDPVNAVDVLGMDPWYESQRKEGWYTVVSTDFTQNTPLSEAGVLTLSGAVMAGTIVDGLVNAGTSIFGWPAPMIGLEQWGSPVEREWGWKTELFRRTGFTPKNLTVEDADKLIQASQDVAFSLAGVRGDRPILPRRCEDGRGMFVRFRSDYANPLRLRDMSVLRSNGIGGAHNLNEFNRHASALNIISRTAHPTQPGIFRIAYQIPALDRAGNPTGSYKAHLFLKTVYDPSIISDSVFATWGRQAAAEAHAAGRLTREWIGTAPNGLQFRGYLDESGAVRSFFPEF